MTVAKSGTSASGRPAAGSSNRTKRGSVASARATAEARSVSPGLRSGTSVVAEVTPRLDLRNDLRADGADDLRHVVLDPDHAVASAEDRVEVLREADLPGDSGHVAELLHDLC